MTIDMAAVLARQELAVYDHSSGRDVVPPPRPPRLPAAAEPVPRQPVSDLEAFVTVDGSHYRVRNGGDRLEANPIGSAGWYTLAFFDPGWEPGRGILLALLGKPSDEALMAELRRTEEFAKRDRTEMQSEVDRLRGEAARLWPLAHRICERCEDKWNGAEGCPLNPYRSTT